MIEKSQAYELRPSITNPILWYPDRPLKSKWNKIRKIVLERDRYTCQFCSHVAKKYMNIHHVNETGENDPKNLITCCVACHAIMHIGRNLRLGTIEIWRSDISQVKIVQITRNGIKNSKTLESIKNELPLKQGPYKPNSIEYVKALLSNIGDDPRATLEKKLCAVFVDLKRWQIE